MTALRGSHRGEVVRWYFAFRGLELRRGRELGEALGDGRGRLLCCLAWWFDAARGMGGGGFHGDMTDLVVAMAYYAGWATMVHGLGRVEDMLYAIRLETLIDPWSPCIEGKVVRVLKSTVRQVIQHRLYGTQVRK